MKKFTLIILVLMVKTMTAMAQQLPVLRVTFDGSFSKDMDYIQGNMSLTDTDGSVITCRPSSKPVVLQRSTIS